MNQINKVNLGKSEIEITKIGLGCWQFSGGSGGFGGRYWPSLSPEIINEIVKVALDGGINWFDTAEAYGAGKSERNLANALHAAGMKNGDVVIATKWFPFPRRANSIRKTIDKRLHYLDGFGIDLHQIHASIALASTKGMMDAMADLVKDGKIRSIGVSNWSAGKMRRGFEILEEKHELQLVSNQVKYSLLDRKIETNDILDTARELGITIIAYSPLEQGLLTGRFHEDPSLIKKLGRLRKMMSFGLRPKKKLERTQPLIDALEEIAQAHNASPAQVSLNWLINFHGDVVVTIPGASKTSQMEQNIGAMHIKLSKDEMSRIDELTQNYM
ncbi:aldo/keto reductase [Candidatus Borrarchaeum sp.]|uniref:aldo/keto reductase n=1 Tax=Candidatus Borrarchaeum sp. TaxID=2846742 RepID=UPI00257B57F1|nr:aldo/keto reductase [Candidatus Borrarchaeum sp.]